MKSIVIVLLVVGIALTASSIVRSLIRSERAQVGEYAYVDSTSAAQRKEDAFKQGFIHSCASEAGNEYCTCVYNDIYEAVGYDAFYNLAKQYSRDGVIPQVMHDASEKCW